MKLADFLLQLAGNADNLRQYHEDPVAYIESSDLSDEDKELLTRDHAAAAINQKIIADGDGDRVEVEGPAGTVLSIRRKDQGQ